MGSSLFTGDRSRYSPSPSRRSRKSLLKPVVPKAWGRGLTAGARKTWRPVPVLLAISVAGALLLFNFVPPASAKAPTNFCLLSSGAELNSCQTGAQSDRWIALAKCDNISSPGQRKVCQQQADADLQDAQGECDAQKAARDAACTQLGGAPYDPVINPAKFIHPDDFPNHPNKYFPLTPGTTLIYESSTEHNEVFVTSNTRTILGATCREVHDTVKLKSSGDLTEDTLDWFCQDTDGNVWYFGENAKQIEDGLIVGVEGSWTAGVDGAKPGIAMKAHPAVGDVYRQEFLPGVAEDMGEVVSLTESVTVPYNGGTTFTNCLKTKDTTPLEPDVVEFKFYCPGIGFVLELDPSTGERSELIAITP